MAEGINWDLARAPDLAGPALQHLAAGQAAGQARQKQNALLLYAQNPDAGINALMAIDPAQASALRQDQRQERTYQTRQQVGGMVAKADLAGASSTAAGAGEFELVNTISQMTAEQRKLVNESADSLANYAQSLKAVPPEQRKQALLADRETLISRGIKPEMIDGFDPSDVNIDKVAAQALGVKGAVEKADRDRTFDAGRADQKWEQGFKDKQFDHTVQNDAAQLGQGAQRIGLEGARLNLARQAEGRQAATDARTAMGKPIPAPIVTGYQGNATAIGKIDAAIAAIKARPQALGLDRALGEGVNQRIDPGGIDARAAVSDIGSQKIHDRSGANVTASENPRLKPFIPTVTDTPSAAIKKLERMKQEYLSNNAQIEAQYAPESGYQALRSPSPAAAPPTPAPRPARPSPPQRGQVVDGYRYNGGPPGSPQSWSKQ